MVSGALGLLARSLAPRFGDAPPAGLLLVPPGQWMLRSSWGGQTPLPAVRVPGLKCKYAVGWARQRWVNTATLSRSRGAAADVCLSFSVSDPILQVPVYVAE